MLERLKKLLGRVDELSLRERGIILGALLVVLFLGWYANLIEPLQAREKSLVTDLTAKRERLQSLNEQFALMAEKQRANPKAAAQAKLKQLRAEEARLTEELRSTTQSLVAPELMPDVLRTMLRSAEGLNLVKLEGLGSTPLLKKEAAGGKGGNPKNEVAAPRQSGGLDAAYKHGMQLEFTGDFRATVEFLRRLEGLEWNFFWDSVRFEVSEYPQASAAVRVYTLSLDRHWIGT